MTRGTVCSYLRIQGSGVWLPIGWDHTFADELYMTFVFAFLEHTASSHLTLTNWSCLSRVCAGKDEDGRVVNANTQPPDHGSSKPACRNVSNMFSVPESAQCRSSATTSMTCTAKKNKQAQGQRSTVLNPNFYMERCCWFGRYGERRRFSRRGSSARKPRFGRLPTTTEDAGNVVLFSFEAR